MSTFILLTLRLDYHILLPSNKSIMSQPLITLGGLGIQKIGADLAYSGLTLHLKQKLESHAFSDVSQVLQRALDCESRAKESISFPRSSEKSMNEHHVNVIEYSSESSDDEEADMCVAE
jgi:hypothetical protein